MACTCTLKCFLLESPTAVNVCSGIQLGGVKLVPSGNTDSLTLKVGSQYDTGSASVVSITSGGSRNFKRGVPIACVIMEAH